MPSILKAPDAKSHQTNSVEKISQANYNVNLKAFIKSCIPPVLIPRRRLSGIVGFEGAFDCWATATRRAGGYDAPAILEKVKNAVQQVVDGKAAYERDSVVFHTLKYEMPLLASLLYIALERNQRLSVADFGGSLGGTYFQHRTAFPSSMKLHWSVVEQPHFARCGREHFANDNLQFYETLDECMVRENPDVLLLSGVLQYLPQPYEFLQSVIKGSVPYVIVEKTLCFDLPDRLTVQHVPPSIYAASYPAWFLNESKLKATLAAGFRCITEYVTEHSVWLDGRELPLKGALWKRMN